MAYLNEGMKAMGAYVSGSAGHQTLNATAASAANLDPYIVQLAGEIVSAQNELVAAAFKSPAAMSKPLDASRYPTIAELNRMAAAELKLQTAGDSPLAAANNGQVSLATAGHECGDYSHPLPINSPARNTVNVSPTNVRTWLTNNNLPPFHATLGYACGANTYTCADDYTRGRPYYSSQGTGYCSSPRFRDQAVVTGTYTAWIQYGEPNPEITTYVWPYWNYGNYVQWWHANH